MDDEKRKDYLGFNRISQKVRINHHMALDSVTYTFDVINAKFQKSLYLSTISMREKESKFKDGEGR
jgi:hypothetical protein